MAIGSMAIGSHQKLKPDAEWYNAANNRMCGEPGDGARCGSRPSATRVQCPTDSECTHQACRKHAENEPEALGAHHICIGRHKTGVEGRGESAHTLKVHASCHYGMKDQSHCVATHRPCGVLDKGWDQGGH